MRLSTRQARIFRLALLLGPGLPVPAKKIITLLACSEPTLTRALKELRSTYTAEIKYRKATHTYQLVDPGLLDKKSLRRMHETMSSYVDLKAGGAVSRVSLDKEKKKAVSLSLRMSVLRKIDQLAIFANTTRSDAVELLVDNYIADLAGDYQVKE
ncbi:tellurium resistance protein TerW [Acerihabitans sp. TG2]|uniref:tellurium resistance protein TerW n=1 Tax=Acerihabitans sp. TG2 TaxID=3096008 RepID=UPI002B23BC74|nr:tellurium resistance protein TerW [Acerihabitans sp. TG2]MEA9389603.1 tellurium resistance protein TerW [Acerihabitans sp. TG2]